jgi:uncharacterized protein (TIGR03067 family)
LQGEDLPQGVFGHAQIVLAQGRYLGTRPGLEGSLSSGAYVLNATQDPKWIDLEIPERDQNTLGIYELDADRMRMCYGAPGSVRPTRFTSEKEPPNSGLLAAFRRVGSAEAALKRLEAAEQESADVNLKRIGVGMHNFHDSHGRFPPAAPRTSKTRAPKPENPPHSWRVALLPFVEAAHLYERYRFDEPWDSPHNRELIGEMPDVYRHPSDAPEVTNSAYYVLVVTGTVFDGEQGIGYADVLDGTRYTILVVEAKRDVPWTKPEDVPFDPDKPLPELGGFAEGGFRALCADGAVRFIPESTDEETLRSLFQKADRRKIDWSELER